MDLGLGLRRPRFNSIAGRTLQSRTFLEPDASLGEIGWLDQLFVYWVPWQHTGDPTQLSPLWGSSIKEQICNLLLHLHRE
jgi:hypothetical protein